MVGIAIGMITPPVAINLFWPPALRGCRWRRYPRPSFPHLIGLIVVFLAIVYLPLFIPGFIG